MLKVGKLIGSLSTENEQNAIRELDQLLGDKNLHVKIGGTEYVHPGLGSLVHSELTQIATGLWLSFKPKLPEGPVTLRTAGIEYSFSVPKAEVLIDQGATSRTLKRTNEDLFPDDYQNQNRSREDRYVISELNNSKSVYSFVGVFDGHGGNAISELCMKSFPDHLAKYLQAVIDHDGGSTSELDAVNALTRAVVDFDENLNLDHKDQWTGSCLCGALWNKRNPKNIYLINLGDSRAIVHTSGGTLINQTFDHKPDLETERIASVGGFVAFAGVHRVNGYLAVSRALGDHHLKKVNGVYTPYGPVSAVPAVTVVHIDPIDLVHVQITVASDGIFDVLDTNQLLELISSGKTSDEIRELVGNHTDDDITLITIGVFD